MKIAIITLTTTDKRTGVAEYLTNLIDELQRIDKTNQYYIFTGKDNRFMFSIKAANFREIVLPLEHSPAVLMRPAFHFWQIFILPLWCRLRKIDLIHLPNTLAVTGWIPTVSTLHDIVEFKVPKYSALRTFFRKLMIRSAIRNSAEIITVSESSARDIKLLGAKKVTSIHLGFRDPFAGVNVEQNSDEILKKYCLSNIPYVLFVGTILKHKNVPTLISAFSKVRREHPAAKLVLVGALDNDVVNVKRAINETGLNDYVHMMDYVPELEKLVILKHAMVFCFISSYEGFGIPVLEAQAAGVPVIVNNVASLPEVGGNGVVVVNPTNLEEETARAISYLLKDHGARQHYINKGYQNIQRFSWRTCAEKTLQAYCELSKQ